MNTSLQDRQVHADDEEVLTTSLLFLLEVQERSDDPAISQRASLRLRQVALARLHRCHMDWINELPQRPGARGRGPARNDWPHDKRMMAASASVPDGTGDCGEAQA